MNSVTNQQIIATLFDKLARKKKWGGNYTPVQTLIRWISVKIKRNGKRIKKIIKDLLSGGYLIPHKKRNCISLNPKMKRDIKRHVREIEPI